MAGATRRTRCRRADPSCAAPAGEVPIVKVDPGLGRYVGMRHVLVLVVTVLLSAPPAFAVGESVGGFPSWAERVMHQLTNRARVDPQLEMDACGAACGEAACYTPQPPLYYKRTLNRAARFHAAHQVQNGYFAHTSSCTLVSNLDSLYPASCSGSASCSCVGGANQCSGSCSSFSQRVSLFGGGPSGEIIASPADPSYAFHLWLYENSSNPACSFSQTNGHRWLLLRSSGAVGFGSSGYSVGDFSSGGGELHKIASGSHWPRQAPEVEAWASFHDSAAPQAAEVVVDGACVPLTLGRGTPENGAWQADLDGVGSGCHRYYFAFRDAGGALVSYPETGSLGIGPAASCADWSEDRPSMGAGCTTVPEAGALGMGLVGLMGLAGVSAGRRCCLRARMRGCPRGLRGRSCRAGGIRSAVVAGCRNVRSG